MVGRETVSGSVALCVLQDGSYLTRFFELCVGGVNGKLKKGGFFPSEFLGDELTFLVEGLNEVLFIRC